MAFLNEEISSQLKAVLEPMKENVNIALFVSKTGCESCDDARGYMEEMTALSNKLSLTVYDLVDDKEKALEFEVTLTPAIVLLDSEGKNNGVKFNGIPAGHEINSFISGIMNVSGAGEELPEEMMQRIKSIDKTVNIKVFVTLGCPHCPGAVSKAHKIALLNPNVNAEMIEANTFDELSQKFNVSGVPKIVFNDGLDLLGDQPLDAFLNTIESL